MRLKCLKKPRLSAAWIRIGTVLSRPTNWRQRSSSLRLHTLKNHLESLGLGNSSVLHCFMGIPKFMAWYDLNVVNVDLGLLPQRRLWWALRHRHMQPSHARLLPFDHSSGRLRYSLWGSKFAISSFQSSKVQCYDLRIIRNPWRLATAATVRDLSNLGFILVQKVSKWNQEMWIMGGSSGILKQNKCGVPGEELVE